MTCSGDCCWLDAVELPLSQVALDEQIPALCDWGVNITWTEGSCTPCIPRP